MDIEADILRLAQGDVNKAQVFRQEILAVLYRAALETNDSNKATSVLKIIQFELCKKHGPH